jgi:broad specificity phosphatase PhoE
MSARTRVHLLRHGEVHNPAGVLYGRLPGYRLSERGLAMAARVADVLSRRDVALVVASPLERAQQTAAPLAAALDLPVRTDDRLIEADNAFEGRRFGVGDGSLSHPESWWLLRNPFRPSWGEPYDVLAARMLAAVEDAAAAVPGREAVLVSHQLPIWTARGAAEGRRLWHDPRTRQCSLASLTTLTYAGPRLVAVGYSEPARDLLPEHQQMGA